MGLILEGETLGQKHRYYNKLVAEYTSKSEHQDHHQINYNDPDIDNLFKIDVASKKKNLEYIIEVLKCEDMLYVSRALKTSVWLITDNEYAHIINPDYLYTNLLPHMTSKASQKLILYTRLNLKDQKRVEEFYNYYYDKKDLKTAFKWLPNCSISLIEKTVEKHAQELPIDLKLRLSEKSITVLEIFDRKTNEYDMRDVLSKATFLLNSDPEKFMSIASSQMAYSYRPRFSAKATQIIMKTNPNIILDDFENFATKIHVPTFTKFLKKEDIKDFLLKHFEHKILVKSWFNFEYMKHFIYRMPSEGRFELIKQICIEKARFDHSQGFSENFEEDEQYNRVVLSCASQCMPQSGNANIYRWYKFAPFPTAFADLTKLIRKESNPTERNAMFAVLISCAKRDSKNIQTVLQYYRDNHINEPLKFKINFVNTLLSLSYSHKFDEKTWLILNDIFCSMEVYSDSDNNVQSCLKHIIIYHVVHDAKVNEIVEKKFEFDTLKSFQSKLSNEEKDKVFNYLYHFTLAKILNITIVSESDLKKIKYHILNVFNLLKDWNKDILNYDIILEKIREVLKIKEIKSWNEDLSYIYNAKKSWRKNMFKESLSLNPTQETCINALKHGPEILFVSQENMCLNDSMLQSRLLSKIRIFWPQSLAVAFEDTFRKQLYDKSRHKISVRGLCVLLPQKQLTDLLTKYTPDGTKINWSETNDVTLGIQKNLARYMYLARPQPPVQVVLKYAKGDYLQFVVRSVHSILFNLSIHRSLEHIPTLLDAPVSLQKHGLKIAFAKLKMNELLKSCTNIWKSTKNTSIRATIFNLVFDLLCKQQDEAKIKEIWNIMSSFMDTFTPDENKNIYVTLGLAEKVPLPVRLTYCIKSYKILKSLPPKINCNKLVESVINSTLELMESIDVEFISEVIVESFDNKFTKSYYNFTNVISACLLSAKTEANQTQRYERVLLPLLTKYLAFSKDLEKNRYYLKYNFHSVMTQLHEDVRDIVFEKDMLTPIKLFNDIHLYLESNLSEENYYVLISTWKLATEYMKVIDKYRLTVGTEGQNDTENISDESKWNIMCLEAAPAFGIRCVELLKEETVKYFPSIYKLFSKAIEDICHRFSFTHKIKLKIIKSIQENAVTIEGHLMVLELLPDDVRYWHDKDDKSKICEILASHPSAEVRMPNQHLLRETLIYEYTVPSVRYKL